VRVRRAPVSIGLTETCNVPGTGSEVASPCAETVDTARWILYLELSVISGRAESRVLD
jgi:hypothetical protein